MTKNPTGKFELEIPCEEEKEVCSPTSTTENNGNAPYVCGHQSVYLPNKEVE